MSLGVLIGVKRPFIQRTLSLSHHDDEKRGHARGAGTHVRVCRQWIYACTGPTVPPFSARRGKSASSLLSCACLPCIRVHSSCWLPACHTSSAPQYNINVGDPKSDRHQNLPRRHARLSPCTVGRQLCACMWMRTSPQQQKVTPWRSFACARARVCVRVCLQVAVPPCSLFLSVSPHLSVSPSLPHFLLPTLPTLARACALFLIMRILENAGQKDIKEEIKGFVG